MPDRPQSRQKATAGNDAYVAGRDVNNYYYGSAEPARPGLLPRDVPAFTGRDDELARLAALAGGGRVVVSAIGGTAGVGKTALAVHAAHQLLPGFPDGHLYMDLRGYTEGQDPAEPGEVLEVFLRCLGVPAEEISAQLEERAGLLRHVLAGRRVLMVLDNARTEAQVRALLPGEGASLVLVTSRSVLPGLEADERISLDVLPEDEAVAMLARVIGDTRAAAEPQAVAEVARLCGRLPLALRVAGQLLAAHPAWPVVRLAGMLAGERDRLARLGAGDLQVRAAFAVSYAQLALEDARLFRLLGLYPGPDFDVAAAAALAGTEAEEAGPALDRLAGAHLVTEDASGRFGFHDLLRLFALATCEESDSPEDREAAEARLVGYYAELAGFLDSCDSRAATMRRPVAGQPAELAGEALLSMREARAVFQSERSGLMAALDLATRRGWGQRVQELSYSMMTSLVMLRYLDDLLTVTEAGLAAARRTGDRGREGLALTCLGTAYGELRRFEEAVDCHQQSLAILRETGDRHGEGKALDNLGTSYGELRRFEEAVECHQRAAAIFRETGDRDGEGLALTNLGLAYRELRRFEEAVDCYEQDIAICRETGDWHREGTALANLGGAYGELRRFEEAVDCHQQSLAIFQETGDRHGEGKALDNLGGAYGGLGRSEEAVDCHQQSLAILRETGDRHGEGKALDNLGTSYGELRRFEEAVECHQRAAAIFRETGDRHAEGLPLTNLGTAYHELRRFEEAVDCYQQAAAIFNETGDPHLQGVALDNLGIACWQLRRFEEAAECWRQAAAALRAAGEFQEAERVAQLAAGAAARPRRRWGLRRRPSS